MPINVFYIIHVFSIIALVALTFTAFAAPAPERRRQVLIWSGVASLAAFLAGFGLAGMLKVGWPAWLWVKLVCWFLISALAGQAFRHPERVRSFSTCTFVLVLVALSMVYFKPF